MRRRRNNLSRGLRWENRKWCRRSSYGRVLCNYFRIYDPSTGRYLESDPIGLQGGLNTYGYALQNPLVYADPYGLLNPTKAIVSIANSVNASRLYATGALKVAAGVGLEGTGLGVAPGAGVAAWGLWNLKSAEAAQRWALQQWNEAVNECSSEASTRNLYGAFPFGQEFDDPDDPDELMPEDFF
ncbi:MAG: RHS repeat-associated core domain-containing protein [Gammaproteobacteria bacterium]